MMLYQSLINRSYFLNNPQSSKENLSWAFLSGVSLIAEISDSICNGSRWEEASPSFK